MLFSNVKTPKNAVVFNVLLGNQTWGNKIFFSLRPKYTLSFHVILKEGTRFGPYPIVFFSERDYNLLYAKMLC